MGQVGHASRFACAPTLLVALSLCLSPTPSLGQVSRADSLLAAARELNARVISLYRARNYGEALPLAERVLALREAALGRDHPDVATDLNNLASLYYTQGRPAEAISHFRRALTIYEAALGPDHPELVTSLNNLAGLYKSQARYADAEPLYRQALAIRQATLGYNHPDVATSLNHLAMLYHTQARYAEAEPLYQRALTIREAMLGPDHPDVAQSLNNLAEIYRNQARYTDAEPLYLRALAIKERALGSDHLDVASSLNNLANLYRTQARYAEAEPLYRRALQIRERALDPNHPDVAGSLNSLAALYFAQAHYADAEPLFRRALAIKETVQGPDHPEVATALNNLAVLYKSQGQYAEAEPLYRRALAIRETALGDDHPDVATSLNSLAGLYGDQGRYADEESLYRRALAIREATLGPDHPVVAASLNSLADLYRDQGRYAEAEPLHMRALAIREAALGPDHPAVAGSLNSLAGLYSDQGRHTDAQPLYRRALQIREATLGPDHPDVAESLNNLAVLIRAQGRYADAEPLYLRALEITQSELGPDHLIVGRSLNNLAELYVRQDRYADAEQLFRQSLTIKEAVLGPDHLELALSLNNLAGLYHTQDRYAYAEPLYLRALALREEALPPDHPEVAQSLHNLAGLYSGQGRYADAETLFRRALAIWEGALGPDHPLVAMVLNNLARLCIRQGDYDEARPLVNRAILILDRNPVNPEVRISAYINRAWIERQAGEPERALEDLTEALQSVEDLRPQVGGGERVRAEFVQRYSLEFDRMVHWQIEAGEPEAALRWSERGRARVLLDQLAAGGIDLRAGIPSDALRHLEEREADASARLAEFQQRITHLRSRTDLSSRERRTAIEAFEDSLVQADDEYRQVYQEIKSASPLWRDLLTSGGEPTDLAAIQGELVPVEGLLLIYQIGDEASHLFMVPPLGQELEVLALDVSVEDMGVLEADEGPLTSAGIDAVVFGKGAEDFGGLFPRGAGSFGRSAGTEAEGGVTDLDRLEALRRVLVPAPLWERVLGAQEVIVVPDGALHQLPFEVLVAAQEGPGDVRYWLDEGPPIRYAASATTLHNIERRVATGGSGVLSVSNPIFDLQEVVEVMAVQRTEADAVLVDRAEAMQADFMRAGGSLTRLAGTARETDVIREAFAGGEAVTVLQGLEASESNLRSTLADHRYLHLATHGLVDERRGSLFASLAFTPPPIPTVDPQDDGFLHLFEIYGLALSSVEIAVLSACDTHVGESFEGEGVFAMSRGFLASGAQRVVASQWQVDDASTAVLMGRLFQAIAEAQRSGERVDYARALRDAKLAVRNDPDHPQWAGPYFWAPFILTGKR